MSSFVTPCGEVVNVFSAGLRGGLRGHFFFYVFTAGGEGRTWGWGECVVFYYFWIVFVGTM